MEIGKKGLKSSFISFHKGLSLIFPGNNLKLKSLSFSFFLCKPYIWKISVSQVIDQSGPLQSDCWILFDYQYCKK